MSEPNQVGTPDLDTIRQNLLDLAAIGRQLARMFSPPPVVTRVLLDRFYSSEDGASRLGRQVDLMACLYRLATLYGDTLKLVRFVAFDEGDDPIPWYGLRAAHVQQIADYYRGRLSPKAHKRLCRVFVEGMTVVHEAGRISQAEMDAIRQAAGVR